MKTMRKNKSVFQQPNLDVNKNDMEKADKLFANFYNATQRQITNNIKEFSTFNMLKKQFSKDKQDPSEAHVLEIVKRMEKDKLSANIAMNIAERSQNQAQGIQRSSLIKMIPYLVGLLGIIICVSLLIGMRPFKLSNPSLFYYAGPLLFAVPLFIWGFVQRKAAKVEMLAINMLMQAASAYSSAKVQGKGAIAAMQNLSEMKTRSKKLEEKQKQAQKKKK